MSIQVRYFASLREQLGEGESVDWSALLAGERPTVGRLREWLAAQDPAHARALGPGQGLRTALNQAMVGETADLEDGAEVAFFPPVTGG